jgi:hypothetical protein
MIAGIALVTTSSTMSTSAFYDPPLYTCNPADFKRVDGLLVVSVPHPERGADSSLWRRGRESSEMYLRCPAPSHRSSWPDERQPQRSHGAVCIWSIWSHCC